MGGLFLQLPAIKTLRKEMPALPANRLDNYIDTVSSMPRIPIV